MIAWKIGFDGISPARRVLVRRGIIWAVIFALLFYLGYQQQIQVMVWPHLSAPLVPDDSDVWLRLNQVRQWIAGGSFFDHSIPRTNAPFGGIAIP